MSELIQERREKLKKTIRQVSLKILENPDSFFRFCMMGGCAYLGFRAIPQDQPFEMKAIGALSGSLGFELARSGGEAASISGMAILAALGLMNTGLLTGVVESVYGYTGNIENMDDAKTRAMALQSNPYLTLRVKNLLASDIDTLPFSYDVLAERVVLYEGVLEKVMVYVASGGVVEYGSVDENWRQPGTGGAR